MTVDTQVFVKHISAQAETNISRLQGKRSQIWLSSGLRMTKLSSIVGPEDDVERVPPVDIVQVRKLGPANSVHDYHWESKKGGSVVS